MSGSLLRAPAKWLATRGANFLLWLRGWQLPDYFDFQARITVLFRGIEHDVVKASSNLLSPGMTVLDVGANVGILARHFCSCVGPQGKVVAFEPERENARALTHNLRRYPQAEVVPVALSDHNGPAAFFIHSVSGTGNSLVPHATESRRVDINCQRLDDFLASREELRPDLIKIDVEGGEFLVLQGMPETLEKFPSVKLLVEICPGNLGGPEKAEALIELLKTFGHEVFLICKDGSLVPFRSLTDHVEEFAPHGYVNVLSTRAN